MLDALEGNEVHEKPEERKLLKPLNPKRDEVEGTVEDRAASSSGAVLGFFVVNGVSSDSDLK